MKKSIITITLISLSLFSLSQTVSINTELTYKVNLPTKKTDKTPVIIMLHGYGSNESDLFDISKSFDERFITFSIRGPYNATGGQGYSWFGLDFLPQKQFKMNYNEVKLTTPLVYSFISNACKAYKLDSTQVFLLGYSQGAIMSYDLAFNKPDKIKGVIALSGMLMKETKEIKIDTAKIKKVHFFVAHGTQDNVVDYKAAEEVSAFLQAKKVPLSFTSYQIPHSISGQELNDIKAWLKSKLAKEIKEKAAEKKTK